jgi:branched-chain amino acid transport system ATP-binding protein
MSKILEVKGLSKAFGGLQALLEFHMEVAQGELVGIIGPNGAGKTTLFNLMTGFLKPDKGQVILKGFDITGLKPHQIVNRGMTRTFQLVELFKDMSVLETVMVPLLSARARKSYGGKPWQRAMEYLERMGLTHRALEKTGSLAFGELRLLDIARAMATEPEVLLLDEPFSGLDVEDAKILSEAISQMHGSGQTMVIIEHRLKDLLKLAQRVVALVFGEKVAEGTPQQVMEDQRVISAYLGQRRL